MARPHFTVSSTRFSDSEDEEDELLSRTDSMRYDSTVRVGNRTKHSSRYIQVDASPGKQQRRHSPEPDLLVPDVALDVGDFGESATLDFRPLEDNFAFDEGHPLDSGPRSIRESDRPLNMWAEYDKEAFLDELLRCEGRGDYHGDARCAGCRAPGNNMHRCEDCFTDALYCTSCVVSLHADNPFHVVKTWNGTFFRDNTLRNLGLRVQLGHKRGERCPGTLARTAEELENREKNSFCVVDSNAIHEVALDFCTCGKAQSPATQLLRVRLYPATTLRPSSAATFRVLRQFHKQSFESKCSAYEFYNALARQTNNTGNFQPRDRYREFLRMTREWRHLQMLKRSGRAHLPDGVRNIEAGACALLCPACPQPGKNLPVNGNWKSAPQCCRFLYALFLAIDANFRMKRKQVSSEEADPGLNDGAAFFSEVKAYMEHVRKHWDFEQEKSRCVSHDAVNQPDREARGTASSGIGTVDCARHNMKRPNGVGDLQKGERYINMDYMLWKSLAGYDDLVELVVSYDIVCQWSINIWVRLAEYEPELKERAGTGYRYWVWLIPKFHLPAHIEACNILYSFDLSPYVAQTDGEAPERGWANANPLAASTREMGPGARRDVLDDHFNDWNHKKIIALGRVMLERIQKAVGQMMEKQEELVETEASLPPEIVEKWTIAMELWEDDPKKNPNPFDVKEKHASLQAVRGRIAAETKHAVEGDRADDVRGDLHASEMLAMGMQLESQQRDLASDAAALKAHATDGQKTTVLERENKLRRKIATWIKLQTEFQPDVARFRERDDLARAQAARMQPTAGVPVEAIELWLPSKQARTPGATVKASHARYEFDMREARAYEALEEIRRLLLVRTHHYKHKDKNVSGVGGHTRARHAIEVLDERIRREAGGLSETRWSLVLKELAQKDIRGMPRALFSDPEKKKRKRKKRARQEEEEAKEPPEMSWIWRTGLSSLAASASTSEEAAVKATNESLRIEWGKAWARAHRWTEEVDLLEEEMRRILVFMGWRAGWWRGLAESRAVDGLGMKEGFIAYAERQAAIQDSMKARFTHDWRDVATWIELGRRGVADFKEQTRADREGEDESDDETGATDDESFDPVPLLPRDAAVVSTALVEGSLLPAA
ncbi:CxC2 domain-containing protein [Mycena sanguinolenta]|uniref:CxC2 domain-containing protein n=1 Tax=Mycena sanguinolenta TaxID=230812 RepID=A0A8H6XJZ0_9AGAR|nr:CxC2 domain-containing protein [Mycena sanguinolenta]